ncbi:MAG: SDR family NAD(P)-dependent oxidoreductase [Acidobacteriota bacterium]
MAKKQKLQDQVAIVTGASIGIGRATALALAREGAHVALASRNIEALCQVADEIERLGRQSLVVPTDVTQRPQVEEMVRATLGRWGRVDILVANAGVYVRSRVNPMMVGEVERAMSVNFYGALYCVLGVLPHMLTQRSGHVILVNTMDAKKAIPPDAPYVASKFALAGFGEVLRQELHDSGVRVTSIFPGRVDTPMIEHLKVPWISRKISAESVAHEIVGSIYRYKREVVIPRGAWVLIYLNLLSPRLADKVVRVLHFEGWET